MRSRRRWVGLAAVVFLGAAAGVAARLLLGREEAPLSVGVGRVSIDSRPTAQLVFESRTLGRTPQLDLYVPAGRQTFHLIGPDGLRRRLDVHVERDAVTKIVAELEKLPVEP